MSNHASNLSGSRSAFVDRYGGIYEHSRWVAENVAARHSKFDSVDALADALCNAVDAASRERKLDLIRAHPDLAGRAAREGELTAASTDEQASAGLDRCTREELARIDQLNRAYREKFGFPFVMAVRGKSKREVFAAFERRLQNTPDREFNSAMAEIHRIARLRLDAMEHDLNAAG